MTGDETARIPQMLPWLGEDEAAAVAAAVRDNWITEGPRSAEFSRRLNALIGVEYGVFAPNGTLALALAAMALGIGAGDEVIVPDTTFIGSATAVVLAGATPVFVDVAPHSFQFDTDCAEAAVTPRTRAVMPVHLYGAASDMDAVADFARRHDLVVIEDAAQGIGVAWRGRPLGGLGDAGCFSFFADKTLTTGEGGYVVCRDEAVYEKLRLLRNQGRLERGSFIHPALGFNFRITDLQAAIGLAQLDKLETVIRRKTGNMTHYRAGLDGVAEVAFLDIPEGSGHAPFRCVLLCADREGLEAHLTANGVEPRGFFYPLHRQPCFAHLDREQGGGQSLDDAHFPNANDGYARGLCLPVFPTLSS